MCFSAKNAEKSEKCNILRAGMCEIALGIATGKNTRRPLDCGCRGNWGNEEYSLLVGAVLGHKSFDGFHAGRGGQAVLGGVEAVVNELVDGGCSYMQTRIR